MGKARLGFLGVTTLTLAVLVALGSGCKRKNEYNGIGKWILGKTMLKDWGYTCQPSGKMTWCQANPLEKSHVVSLGGQNAVVGTLFDGTEPASELVEIVLEVDGCNVGSLKSWLESEFGDPSGKSEDRMYWKGKYAFIAARVPASQATCKINMVDPHDQKRVAELEAETKKK